METEKHGHEKLFKILIDKKEYEVPGPIITGLQLLQTANKQPPEQYALYLKVHAGQPQRVQLTDKVDLSEPGHEKFLTLPLDQTEGLGARRDFALPADDQQWLESSSLKYELVTEGGILRVVMYDYPVPPGYNLGQVAANVRIDPGYPDTQIDMVYFWPALARTDSKEIGALTEDSFDGKSWQRWSRHRTGANPWRPGIDNLSTHMAAVEQWLLCELLKG